MITAEQIKEYIEDELLEDDEFELSNSMSLFKERVLDSLNLLALISFLESEANIKIDSSEISLENIDSIDLMVAFVARKSS